MANPNRNKSRNFLSRFRVDSHTTTSTRLAWNDAQRDLCLVVLSTATAAFGLAAMVNGIAKGGPIRDVEGGGILLGIGTACGLAWGERLHRLLRSFDPS